MVATLYPFCKDGNLEENMLVLAEWMNEKDGKGRKASTEKREREW